MNISINEDILEKYDLTLEEFLVLVLCSKESNIEAIINSLIAKGIVDRDLHNNISAVVSDNTKDLITSIIIDSDKKVINKDEEFNRLATKMKELYPTGIKPGTTYYWRDSVPVIAKKLKTLVAKFGVELIEKDVLDATKRYIEFHEKTYGNYTYMHLLKYFILKTDKSTGELRSELLSYLENADQEDEKDDWTSTLV